MKGSSRILAAFTIALAVLLAGCMQGDGDVEAGLNADGEAGLDDDGLSAGVGSGITARFVVGEDLVRVGTEVAFDASSTVAPSEDNGTTQAELEYEWSFGDGRTATGVQVRHTYQDAGVYAVLLVVRSADGNEGNTTSELRVLPPPSADLSASFTGSFAAGAPVENSLWTARHDLSVDTAQSDVTIALEGSGVSPGMSLALESADGEVVATGSGSGGERTITLSFLASGSYTLVVKMTQGANGTYSVEAAGTATLEEDSQA